MPDPHIRPVIDSDLTALIWAFGQADFFFDRFSRQSRGRGALLIALRGGAVVGNVYLWWEPAEEAELRERLPGVPVLTHLEVRSDQRNRGIGTALLAEGERILRQRGHHRVALGVGLANADAQRLYSRLAYVEWDYPPVRTAEETFQIFVKALGCERDEEECRPRCGSPDQG
ncbi:GNAT family N-acetyltransferase [Spongiactinospora sp. TRM90649]|uniref:GNAT family N-acetyltransferase n=1 Tax=Spongiactinospora sp. TRM90649 TaxID=3031114 RepID=UPI0023F71413|nr:GNAT family N-acetyltransferase [Spongiactinospora sp. TRM90649]MDF5752356.1 GNAT family N-acetyltransferase [Spongiactinospora sp. TRM90649]